MNMLKDCAEISNGVSGIYMLISPSGGRYVGQSKCLKKRLIDHKCPSRINKNEGLYVDMRKNGFELFKYEILETCESEFLNEREAFWIKKIKPEFNNSTGGFSSNGTKRSEEFKEMMSNKLKLVWLSKSVDDKNKIIKNNLVGRSSGYNHTAETKEKISEKLRGKKQSIETILKRSKSMSKSMIGNKNGSKRIASFFHGKKIREYESIIEAAKDLNIHPSGITKVIKGKQSSAGGFTWCFLEN